MFYRCYQPHIFANLLVTLTSDVTIDAGDVEINEIRLYGYAYEETSSTPINAGDGYIADEISMRTSFLDATFSILRQHKSTSLTKRVDSLAT